MLKTFKYINHNWLISEQKELLNLFDDLSNIFLTDKTLVSSKDENESENENEDYDETIDQNKIIKEKNDFLDKIIDKSKSSEDQIESIKKVENLDIYYDNDFDDKELKYKYFKIKLAHLSNFIEENLFEQIFGHTLIKLAEELINTTNKQKSNNC